MSELRNRAYGQQNGTLEVRRRDLSAQVRAMEAQFALALPRGASAAQLTRDVLTLISQNPSLAECEPMTVLGGAMAMAQLGLRPGVLGHGWLIPFKGRAQLVIGYQGMLELAHRSGAIASIQAHVVHERDDFRYSFGLHEVLEHTPARGERGEATHYYCVEKSQGGGVYWDVITHADAVAHRDRFAMAKDRSGNVAGPWRDHFDSMALKTVIKRVLKLAPRSTEIAMAIEVDETSQVHRDVVATLTETHVEAAAELEAGPGEAIEDDVARDDAIMDGAEAAAEGGAW